MKIKPVDRDIRNLLESHFFVIPRFQRPYSWDRENLSDFWTDICESQELDYFIGSMVVYRNGQHSVETFVVDGQQRLTTIVLLLCAVRDRLSNLGERDLATGLQGLIERPDIDNTKRFTLFSETPYPYLQDHIQKFGEPELNVNLGPEEESLKAAYDEFCQRLDAKLAAIEASSSKSKRRKGDDKVSFLLSLRDRALRLQTILIEMDNEDDAYLIFETLNTRGKDLEPADLVKNHLTRLLRPTNRDNDVTREKWNNISRTIHGADTDVDVNSFLLHQWISERDYVAQKKLFKEIRQSINRAQARSYLNTLESEAGLYRTIFEVDYKKWKKEEIDIRRSLEALQIFRIRQAVPTVLALLRSYTDNQLTKTQMELALSKLENFHFIFTAVTSQRGSGGLASMYSRAARDVRLATGKNDKQQAIKDLIEKLRDRVPSADEFRIGFSDIRFSDQFTRQRHLVRYILRKLDAHIRPAADGVDYDQMTIEHLAPQSSSLNEDGVGSLGNLILVPAKLNNEKLGSKGFAEKKRILKENGVPLDSAIENARTWTEREIKERTSNLATLAYDKIWRV